MSGAAFIFWKPLMPLSLLRHIDFCTAHNADAFLPFVIQSQTVGYIAKHHVDLVLASGAFLLKNETIIFADAFADYQARSNALERTAQALADTYGISLTKEIYPVIEHWGDAPFAAIDRAAIPWFGTLGFGVHANGYVRKADGLYLWVATRAMDRRIDPGKRDNLIGGGLPMGYSITENLAKEAWEEAGLPPALIQNATAHGHLRYKRDMMHGVRNDTLFVFDLELPEGLTPHNTDGEVERFDLLPAAEVLDIVTNTDTFKFNCNLVMIDFLLRHGVIGAAHPEYAALQKAMAELKK